MSNDGYDIPLHKREDDFYGRWAVARAISNLISATPSKWSARIGIFGRWGDGKTSVLKFVEAQQEATSPDNVVVRFDSWGVSSIQELLNRFCSELSKALKAKGIKLKFDYKKKFRTTRAPSSS